MLTGNVHYLAQMPYLPVAIRQAIEYVMANSGVRRQPVSPPSPP